MDSKIIHRFNSKIDKSAPNGCWEWTAAKSRNGYGNLIFNGRACGAHRASWEIHNGPIPKGNHRGTMCILHKCDNKLCVNPKHLFIGTQKDNMRDLRVKGRGTRKLTEHQVLSIRKMYASEKYTQGQLADRFMVDRTTIGYVVRKNGGWRHI